MFDYLNHIFPCRVSGDGGTRSWRLSPSSVWGKHHQSGGRTISHPGSDTHVSPQARELQGQVLPGPGICDTTGGSAVSFTRERRCRPGVIQPGSDIQKCQRKEVRDAETEVIPRLPRVRDHPIRYFCILPPDSEDADPAVLSPAGDILNLPLQSPFFHHPDHVYQIDPALGQRVVTPDREE